MPRALSFAALASLLSLAASCGGADDDAARVTTPDADTSEAGDPQTALNAPDDPARPALTGKQIFDARCAHCHASGEEHPGTFQLAATRGEEYAVLEMRADLTAVYVKYIVRNGLNAMPPFTPTTITDSELDVLAGYLETAE